MIKRLAGLAGVGVLLALVLACGFGGGGDDDDDDDDFARGVAVVVGALTSPVRRAEPPAGFAPAGAGTAG